MHDYDNKKGSGPIDLEEALRLEADAERPAFSEALHARILETVRSEPTVQVAQPSPGRRAWGFLVTAATILVLLGAVAWNVGSRSIESKPTEPPIVESSPALESSETALAMTPDWDATDRWIEAMTLQIEEAQRSGGTFEADWIDQPLTVWNHDAKVLADWVLDPLTLIARGS